MKNRWLFISIFIIVILFGALNLDSSWAADPGDQYNNLDQSLVSNYTDISNNSCANQYLNNTNQSNQGDSHLNSISGKVIRCDSGAPFSGVNIKISDINGNLISKTQTDKNGNYNINFNSKDVIFKVTASYPCHITLSKILTLAFSGSLYCGTANFQLGPEPSLTINAPAEQFINETFNFNVNFDNTGNETGFGPIIQLILPPQIQFNSATFLGSPVGVTNVGVFPGTGTGTLTDPLSGLSVTGTSGYRLYILQYPLGSYTKGQPIATININALLLGNSTLGVPLNITAYPVFRFGANETGGTPLRGNATNSSVTPTVIKLTKTSDAPETETATGRNYPRTYTLTVDVADGQTVTDINIRDIIPGNLQFIQILNAAGGTVIQQPDTHVPGGNIWIHFSSITGILGPDKLITYQVFAPKNDSLNNSVLDPLTGLPTNAANYADVNGTYNGLPVNSSANYTLTLKSLAIQKSVTNTSTDPIQPKPTDILKYNINFQVSDYFSLNNLVITDALGDGQKFLNSGSYIPFINVKLHNATVTSLYFNLADLNQFQMYHDNNTGITLLTFNITRLLMDNGYGWILQGGNYTGIDTGATFGNLTFWSQININFENPPDHPIVSGDPINNNVRADANLSNNGSPVSDTSAAGVVIVEPTSKKTIAYIRRNGVLIPVINQIRPGDEVTFALTIHVPTSNLEDFYLVDYLPIPLFRSSEFTNLNIDPSPIPGPGRWGFGSGNTLTDSSGTLIIPTLSIDALQNTLKFYYGHVHNSSQINNAVQILFTVTATGDPFADGLYLTNLLNINYNNTFGEKFSDNQIVSFIIHEPVLNINKTATPTTNLQAGNKVTYTITITNTGNAPAYNVVVRDNLLTANPGFIASTVIAAQYGSGALITGLNFADLFTSSGLNFGTLYPIYENGSTNNTILIIYNATLNSTVYPLQVINNTAQITNFTALPSPDSPNFVKDPTMYQDSESVNVAGPQFTKTYVGSQGGPSTSPNLTIGEVGRFRLAITLPAGQINDLVIRDTLPAGLKYVNHNLINNPDIALPSISFTQNGNLLTFMFNGITTTGNVTNRTFYIDLDVRMDNNNTANPPHTSSRTRTNTATMDWNNTGHAPITRTAVVSLIEPNLTVNKTFTPNVVHGGQTTTVRLRVRNYGGTALSTAYNVIITDSLAWASQLFDLSSGSVVIYNTPAGFTPAYNETTQTITFTGGNIPVSSTYLDFYFNLTALPTPYIGINNTNVANATYWSLPWIGSNPDPNSRNYTNNGTAIVRTGDPALQKIVETSTIHGNTGNLTIGEIVTYRLRITLPQGLMTNLRITDILPPGFSFNSGEYLINTAGFNGVLGTFGTPVISGQNVTFLFNGLTNSTTSNNIFYIYLNATVLNNTLNQNGNIKTNNMTLTWNENARPPFNTSVNTTIVEPRIQIVKEASPTTVDGSDRVTINIRVTNTGSSPAYQLKITDLLNTTLFNPATWTYNPVAGFNFIRNGDIISIIADSATSIAPGATQVFTFFVNVTDDVPATSTFTNIANASFSSMPEGFNETRNYTNNSNVVTFTTPSPSITKIIAGTSEPDSIDNKVLIGEVVTYKINITVPEGKTLNAVLRDILPSNLQFNPGTALIMRSSDNIFATGFNFNSSGGVYQFLDDSYFAGNQLNLLLGNITYNGIDGLHNGNISIWFNATVLNILQNQNGTQINNSARFNFTNATGAQRELTGSASSLNVTTPKLSATKTADKSLIQGGETVKYTIVVQNILGATAPAYDIVITDYLPAGMSFSGMVTMPSGWIVTVDPMDPRRLIFTSPAGFKLDNGTNVTIEFNATAIQNITYNSTLNNTINATGTSLPGPHGTNNATPGNPGTTNGERTGDGGPADLNNIFATANVTITSRSPSISKGANKSTAPVGEAVTHTVTIQLPGGYTPNLTIVDNLPSGMDYMLGRLIVNLPSGVTSGNPIAENSPFFNIAGQTITFNLGWLNATAEGNITISYDVMINNIASNINNTNLTNNATLNFINGQGGTSTSGPVNSTVRVVEPQLQISKTSDKTNYNPGETVRFTLNVSHTPGSTSNAYNLKIMDTLPNGLTYQIGSSILPAGWLVDESQYLSNIVIFHTNSITALLLGDNAQIMFNCTVGNYTWAGQNLTNNAGLNYTSVFNETSARTYGPENASATVHVTGADIYVTKTTSTPSLHAGQPFSYSIRVGNNGPDTAVNVKLNDLIDAAGYNWLSGVQYRINGIWYNFTNNMTVDLGNITSGSFIDILLNGTVNSGAPTGTINNTAIVNSTTADPYPENNTDTALINVGQQARLSIEKTVTESTVTAGTPIHYTVTVRNNGPSDAYQVRVTDTLPSYVTGLYYSLNNGVTWNIWNISGEIDLGTLAANAVQQIWINGTVNSATPDGTLLNNTVNVTSPTDPDSHEAWVTSTVNTTANLTLTKSNNPSGVIIAGNNLIYTITLTNIGPSVARNVILHDDTLSNWLINRSYSYSINGGSWSSWIPFTGNLWINVTNSTSFPSGYMGVLDNFVVQINSTVNSSTPNGTILFNFANATSDTSPFEVISNEVTNNVQTRSGLNILKSAPASVIAGQAAPIQFTLHIWNDGPSDALDVVLTDIVDLIRVHGAQYSWDGSLWNTWTGSLLLGNITAGNSFDMFIRGNVNASALGWINNTANLTTSTPNDGNLTSNTTTDVNTLSSLNIVKSAPSSVTAGQSSPLVFTLHISNNGPSDALNVNLTDLVDETRLSNIEYYWNGPWYAWTGSLYLGTVSANSTLDILIRGNVLSSALGWINNTAVLTTDTPNDGNLTSNTTTDVNTLSSLNIVKSAPSSVTAGQSSPLVFTLHITNNGPSDAQNVVLSDAVDNRLTQIEYLWNSSIWAPWIGSLSLGTVTAGSDFYVYIRGIAPADLLGEINNTAALTTDTPNDGNLTSNTTTDIDTYAELILNKMNNPQNRVTAGNSLIYTINLTNNGPSVARDVIFTDNSLSSYLLNRFYRYSINGGSWIDGTSFSGPLIMNLSSILPSGYLGFGENFTVEISGTVNASTPNGTVITNFAEVTSSTNPGGVISNTVENTVETLAELVITKVADVEKIIRGHPIHYTITITNRGPSDALNVNFYDDYDPKILLNTFYSTSTGIPWTAFNAPLNLTNLVSVLAPGSNITIWINGTVSTNASQNLTNTAITSSETDPDGNKTAQVTTPIQTSDVSITKTVSNPRPHVHETIFFTLIVQNRGPDTAINVYAVDKLPAGVKYVSSRANYGSYDPNTGIWTIGNLPRGTIARLVITVVVVKVGPLENHAHVNTDSYDPILNDNNSTVSLKVLPQQAHAQTIPMQRTGIPISLMLIAVLAVLVGLIVPKRK